jgi:hypothetical protein
LSIFLFGDKKDDQRNPKEFLKTINRYVICLYFKSFWWQLCR